MINSGNLKELQKLEQVLVQLFGPLKKDPNTMIQYPELGIALLKLVDFNNTVLLKILDTKDNTGTQTKPAPTWKGRKVLWLRSLDNETAKNILNEIADSYSPMDYHESIPDMYAQFIESYSIMNDKMAGLHFLYTSTLKKVPDIKSDTLGQIKGVNWIRIMRLLSQLQLNNLKSLEVGDEQKG